MRLRNKKKEEEMSIERWFNNNLDTQNRTIYMGSISGGSYESGVDNFMAEYFIKALHILENINNEPVIIIMNNPGGSWYHGMAIFDAITYSPCSIIIKVYGSAMSMGSVILQAADYRIMMPNARMMIHYGTNGFFGDAKNLERWSDEGIRINLEMENIYIKSILKSIEINGKDKIESGIVKAINRSRINEFPKQPEYSLSLSDDEKTMINQIRFIIRDLLKIDTILSSDESVELGLADIIFTKNEIIYESEEKNEEK